MYNLYNNITKADKLENIINIAKANESASRSFAVLLQASNMQEEKQMQIAKNNQINNIENEIGDCELDEQIDILEENLTKALNSISYEPK